jgi:hypothetical protein
LKGEAVFRGGALAGREQFLLRAAFGVAGVVLALRIGQGIDPSLYAFTVYGITLVTALVCLPLRAVFIASVFLLPIVPTYFDITLASSLPYISIHKITLSLLSLYWAAARVIRRKGIVAGPPFVRALLALVFFQAVSVVTALNLRMSFFAFTRLCLENYLIFFMTIDLIRTRRAIVRVFNAMLLSAVVVSVIGLVHYLTGHYPLDFIPSGSLSDSLWNYYDYENLRLGILRINSVFTHSIILGMFLNLVLPAALILVTRRQRRRQKGRYLVAIVVILAAIILSLSRATWAATIAGFGIVLMLWEEHRLRYTTFVPIVFGGLVLLIGGSQVLPSLGAIFLSSFRVIGLDISGFFHLEGINQLRDSTLDRAPAILAAWEKILSRPLVGYGVTGNDLYVIQNQGDIFYLLKIALDSGVPALLAILYFLYRLLRNLYGAAKAAVDPDEKGLLIACLAGLAAYLINLQGATFPDIAYLFWIVSGMAVNLIWRRENEEEPDESDNGSG